ncbi:winged helix-turn-helix transcriptional regulator [Geminicoccus roseus]|uniref:winged helix-turn-helix transcriptional regulator n=1 Tax=Geminicoccus roseus TaxID=404900 RepID=UPI00040691D7|nr:helix-turn-helix domain-containing protein [Geminicoccus roseus]
MPPTLQGNELIFEEDCAPRRVMELFTVKWTSMVIHALFHLPQRTARTGVLQRSLPGISKKMLVQTLRDMEQRGLVRRKVYEVVPPKVEYALTPLGETFAQPIEMLYRWGAENEAALDALQAAGSGRSGQGADLDRPPGNREHP